MARGDLRLAAQLSACAEGLRDSLAVSLFRGEHDVHVRTVAAVSDASTNDAFQVLWAEGVRMRLDEAVALAIEALPRDPQKPQIGPGFGE